MSTNRRRPAGGPRRPQVAGRPRPVGTSGTGESSESTEGVLAVDERTGPRSPGTRTDDDRSGAAPTTTGPAGREPSAPAGGSSRDDAPVPAGAAGPEATSAAGASARDESAQAANDRPPRAAAVGGPGDRAVHGSRRRIPMPPAPASRRGVAGLLAVTVLLAAAAVFFAVSFFGMRFTGSATNTALSDVGTTAAVSEQIGEAVTKVYSFDFARLDQAEADARAGITAPFDTQFDQIFGNVRQLAPQQQAVVTATVPKSAVASIEGDRATVYLFVNQVITRVDDRGERQQGGAAARLRVDAQNVDGRWKIAGMSPA